MQKTITLCLILFVLFCKDKKNSQIWEIPKPASLFASDRLDHLLNEDYGMIKHLDQGTHVISDRYYLSSYAYHSVHVDMDWVIQINAMSALLRRPDITFYIDLPAETAVQRMNISRDQVDIYESLENLKKVRENYLIAIDKIKDKDLEESQS